MLTPDEIKIFSSCAPHLPDSPIVFDLGAYRGGYTDFVKSVKPDSVCYLFEPNTSLFLDLRKKYNAFNVAVSDTTGNDIFYTCLNKEDELSSLIKREIFSELNFKADFIRTITIDSFCSLLNINNIDFLKVDVEGAELDVLYGSKWMLTASSIKFIQVEYGGTYEDSETTFKQIIEYVSHFGYKVYELINDKLSLVALDTFIEDYRFTNFLITRHDFR